MHKDLSNLSTLSSSSSRDICVTLYPQTKEVPGFFFFSEKLIKLDHVLDHQIILNKQKELK